MATSSCNQHQGPESSRIRIVTLHTMTVLSLDFESGRLSSMSFEYFWNGNQDEMSTSYSATYAIHIQLRSRFQLQHFAVVLLVAMALDLLTEPERKLIKTEVTQLQTQCFAQSSTLGILKHNLSGEKDPCR